MIKNYGQKKLNKKQVERGLFKFFLSFFILSFLVVLVVFMFFKSYDVQTTAMKKNLRAYRTMLDKDKLLHNQMDSIYYKMDLLGKNKVDNEIFLRNSLYKSIIDTKNIMGEDSIDDLSHYNTLLKNIEKMVSLKTDIITASDKERIALRDLNECMGEVRKINQRLRQR